MKVEYIEETSVRKSLAFEIEPEVVETGDRDPRQALREAGEDPRLPAGQDPGRGHQEALPRPGAGGRRRDARQQASSSTSSRAAACGRWPRPRSTDLKIDENQPLTFRAVFETLPLVELPEYKGLEVKARDAEGRGRGRGQGGRPAARGGRALRSRRGPAARARATSPSSTWPTPGTTARGKQRRERAGRGRRRGQPQGPQRRPWSGMAPGETQDGAHRLRRGPRAAEGLAGRTVDYTLTLKGVKNKVVPAADDEFAKDLGRVRQPGTSCATRCAQQPGRGRAAQGRPRGQGRARRGPGRSAPASRCRRRWSSAT